MVTDKYHTVATLFFNGGRSAYLVFMIKINIPEQLRKLTDGDSVLSIPLDSGEDLESVLSKVYFICDGFREKIMTGSEINKFINIYVNNEDIRFLDGLRTEIKAGDEITIVPAVVGG